MSTIKIFDTTLRDGEQAPGYSMNLAEKLKVARQLEILGVDVIEAGFAVSSPGDFESVQAIANTIKNCSVASLSRAVKKDIDASYEALRNAAAPRIHTFIATSPLHMEYKLKMSPEQVLARIDEMVRYAASLIPDVEFSAEDASRTPHDFLAKAVEAAIRAGAKVVNIPDTVGYATPQEMFDMIEYLKNNVDGIEKADISVHCHDDLGMSVANSLAAVRAGATQIECTINGIGERAGNAALEEVVMALNTRKQYFDCTCNIDTTQLYRASRLLATITGTHIPSNKAIVGKNAFAHESGIHQHGVLANRLTYEIMTPQSIGLPTNTMVLGKHSGKHAFEDRLKELGYNLSPEELESSFTEFTALCDKKKEVTDSDIEALVEHKSAAVPQFYKLERFVVNSGNTINSTAIVKLMDAEGNIHEKVALGDGPVDAAYKAIDQIAEMGLSLSDYRINSVSDGEDALGEVTVKVTSGDRTVRGRGLSTDVIESSILAYINAINKLKS
jgi:2-isopropylmalate synthase